MKQFRVLLALTVLLFYSFLLVNAEGMINSAAAAGEAPIIVNEGMDRIVINPSNESYVRWEYSERFSQLVGETLFISDYLKIKEEGKNINPLDVIDEIDVDLNGSSLAEVGSSLDLVAKELGELDVKISYKSFTVVLTIHIEDNQKFFTVQLPAAFQNYRETIVLGSYPYIDRYYRTSSRAELIGTNKIKLQVDNIDQYNKLKVLIVSRGAIYIAEFTPDSDEEIIIDDTTYSKLIFPNKLYYNIGIWEPNSLDTSIFVNLAFDQTLTVPKGKYGIGATIATAPPGPSQPNEYSFVSTLIDVESKTENVQFSEEGLVPFTIDYTGPYQSINGSIGSPSENYNFHSSNVAADKFRIKTGDYRFSFSVMSGDYSFHMTRNETHITKDTNLTISPVFDAELSLSENQYNSGDDLIINKDNLKIINKEGFELNSIYDTKTYSQVRPVLTMTNIDDPEETFTYTLEHLTYSRVKLPETSGTFDVKITIDFRSDTGEPQPVTLVSVSTDSELKLRVNETKVLKVQANYSDGSSKDITDANLTAAHPELLEISEGGQVKGLAPGETTITIEYQGKTSEVPVTVTDSNDPGEDPKELKSIQVDQESYELEAGESAEVKVSAIFENDEVADVTEHAIFNSADTNIAKVENGKVFGLQPGETVITVIYEGKTAEINVTVTGKTEPGEPENPLQTIETSKKSVELEIGESALVDVIAIYQDGKRINVTKEAVFKSANGNVATVNNGEIIGVNAGETTITVQYGGKIAEVTVTVLEETEPGEPDPGEPENPLQSIQVSSDSFELEIGETAAVEVLAVYQNGDTVNITEQAVFNSANPTIAMVENGTIVGVEGGSTSIKVEYEEKTAVINVVVKEAEITLEKITLDKEKYDITHLGEGAYKVTAHYSNNETMDVTKDVSLKAGDPKVIEIKNGKIKGVAPGRTTLTITYLNKTVQAEAEVFPYLLKLQSASLLYEIEKGKDAQILLEAVYSDKSIKDVTNLASYQSDNPKIAAVSAEGKISGLEEGKTTVKAEFEGKEFIFSVAVLSDETGFEVLIKDSSTKSTIDQPRVMIQLYESNDLMEITQKSSGYFKEELKPGLYEVFVYKKGYMPVLEQVLVENGSLSKNEFLLEKSDLIKAEFTASRMDETDLIAAGIDPNDPDNLWTFKFEAHLAFQGKTIPIVYYGNSKGRLFGNPSYLGGSYYLCPFLIPASGGHEEEDVIPMFAYMIVPGEVSWLKEFFKAQLTIQNLSPEPFSIKDSKISLTLPEGLSLASTFEEQSLVVDIGELEGGEAFYQEWYIRGDEKGEYHLNASFDGTLYPFKEPVRGEFTTPNPIKVWGDDALKMIIAAESNAEAGMPYKVQVRLKNVSDAPIYYLNLTLFEEGKKNYFYSPNTQLAHKLDKLAAGAEITIDFLLIPKISGNLVLSESFVLKTGGNAQIKTEITTIE